MSQTTSYSWSSVFRALVLPLVIGLVMYLCLNLFIDREVISNEVVLRYLTGHPISKITTFMFFIGVAALLLIANNVFDQFCNCDKISLDAEDSESKTNGENTPAETATQYIEHLHSYARPVQGQYLWHRLFNSLNFIQRTGSTAGLEDELKYLVELDQDHQHRRYSLVRIVIWATPMLGFLGTVLGISQALGGIQVGPENDFQGMLNGLRGSLFVAFDTTALALTLSILLMFFQFFVDRFELQLLDTVGQRAAVELKPLYEEKEFLDPQTRAIEQIGRSVLATSHGLVKQQSDQWRESMQSAERAWSETVTGVSGTVQTELAEALRLANVELADSITRGIERADESMAKRWEQWQVLLSENARRLDDSKSLVQAQVELLRKLLEKIESTNGAQTMLNRNLDTLAATSQLHQTLQDLSSSIQRIPKQESSSPEPRPTLRIHRPDDSAEEKKRPASDYNFRTRRKVA